MAEIRGKEPPIGWMAVVRWLRRREGMTEVDHRKVTEARRGPTALCTWGTGDSSGTMAMA